VGAFDEMLGAKAFVGFCQSFSVFSRTNKFACEEWGFQGSKGSIGICMLFAFLVSEHKVCR
jgi:hypothetical protein